MSPLARDLAVHVVHPVLDALDGALRGLAGGPAAEALLLGTAAVETDLGRRLIQDGGGPARGLYQMEPATEAWLTDKYLGAPERLHLHHAVYKFCSILPKDGEIIGNLYYATALARINYWRVQQPLPEASDIEGLARYWKAYWNTEAGAGTPATFILKFKELVR